MKPVAPASIPNESKPHPGESNHNVNPRFLMHLEGGAALTLALFAYYWNHASWGLFALLFLIPDLSMIGYLANARSGAALYNAVHTYIGPVLVALYSVGTDHRLGLQVALIWIAHIGFDRLLGFGLKYPTHFKDTHLNPARHTLALGRAEVGLPAK